jgi:integrase
LTRSSVDGARTVGGGSAAGLSWGTRKSTSRPRVFDRAAEEIGLPGLTPHELRHTAASLAVSAGATVKAVQRMLGHASAAMTLDVYAGLFADDLDAVADRMHAAKMASDADQVRTNVVRLSQTINE